MCRPAFPGEPQDRVPVALDTTLSGCTCRCTGSASTQTRSRGTRTRYVGAMTRHRVSAKTGFPGLFLRRTGPERLGLVARRCRLSPRPRSSGRTTASRPQGEKFVFHRLQCFFVTAATSSTTTAVTGEPSATGRIRPFHRANAGAGTALSRFLNRAGRRQHSGSPGCMFFVLLTLTCWGPDMPFKTVFVFPPRPASGVLGDPDDQILLSGCRYTSDDAEISCSEYSPLLEEQAALSVVASTASCENPEPELWYWPSRSNRGCISSSCGDGPVPSTSFGARSQD